MAQRRERSKRAVRAVQHWAHRDVDAKGWSAEVDALARGKNELFALFGDTDCVHMAVRDDSGARLVTTSVDGNRYPSVGARHAPAIRLERAIRDLFGYEPDGLPDQRPWLDHGVWPLAAPLNERNLRPRRLAEYKFLPAEGEGLHQIPVGPVHAGIIEPGHFRFTANGETVVRLEQRLGYVHKGIEWLMRDAPLERAAQLIGRVSGDSTVAYACAFAHAVEAGLGIAVPPRAVYLRALMSELERVANHLGDFGAVCNDAAFVLIHAHCGVLREEVLAACDAAFGHRLMRDRIVPGGVAADLSAEANQRLRAVAEAVAPRFEELVRIYDDTPSLQDRTVTTGLVSAELVKRFAAGGYVGRASGRDFDARRDLVYPPYDKLGFEVPVLEAGDVDARVRIRLAEIGESLKLVRRILEGLPAGAIRAPVDVPKHEREGIGVVEGFRGDVFVYVRIAPGGKIARCHPRDPSWLQWPLLEVAIKDNIVADFPLCNKSFNCSYSGHDL
jgi:Ni,Fe-hydrogenase III large subunit